MKVTFLGTGTSQGIPVIGCSCNVCTSIDYKDNRLRTSILVESDTTSIVIDTGPDFRQQMLQNRQKKLDAVLFTHEHKDHTAGLDDIRPFNYFNKQKIDVFATKNVQVSLKREYEYIFNDEKYPGIPEIELKTIENRPFTIGDISITPILVYHYQLPVFGYRIKNFTYITDANFIADEELKKIEGSSVFVLNALRKEKHISHFTLNEAIDLMRKINPKKGYFTHISHQLGKHQEVERQLPDFIELAYDGLKIEI